MKNLLTTISLIAFCSNVCNGMDDAEKYSKLLAPLVMEVQKVSGITVKSMAQLYDIAFFATIHDTARLLTKRVKIPCTIYDDSSDECKTVTITQTPISLDEIVRLTNLCNFVKTGTFLKTPRESYTRDAEKIRVLLKTYCTHPAIRTKLMAKLKKIAHAHLEILTKQKTKRGPNHV